MLVLVPNEFLAYTHRREFCPAASNIHRESFKDIPGICYATHSEFLELLYDNWSLELDWYIFIDEADLFFE